MRRRRIVARGFEFPEGPAVSQDGTIYLVDVEGGYISRLAPGRAPEVFHHTGGRPNGLAIHRSGDLYVADAGLRAIIRIDPKTRHQETMCDAYRGAPLLGPNDLCFDATGVLCFTDPLGSSAEHPIGAVYRLPPGSPPTLVLGGLAFPNGLCLDATQRTLYLAETKRHVIRACSLAADGTCTAMRTHATVEGSADGMAFDVAGNLYVALYGRAAIGIIPPEGGRVEYVPVDGSRPTNVAFAGSDLWITEAAEGTLQVMSVDEVGLRLFGETS